MVRSDHANMPIRGNSAFSIRLMLAAHAGDAVRSTSPAVSRWPSTALPTEAALNENRPTARRASDDRPFRVDGANLLAGVAPQTDYSNLSLEESFLRDRQAASGPVPGPLGEG